MSDDIARWEPFAELVQKTRGNGVRYVGRMRPSENGKWVRLDDVATLRLDCANLREQLESREMDSARIIELACLISTDGDTMRRAVNAMGPILHSDMDASCWNTVTEMRDALVAALRAIAEGDK